MTRRPDRILTTHVGSLPRSKAVTAGVFAREYGADVDDAGLQQTIAAAVSDVVMRQVDAGIDIVSDGEMSKISYATYIKDRISGFAGDSPRIAPQDLEDYPGFLQRQAKSGGTPTYQRPACVAEIKHKNMQPLMQDVAHLAAALDKAGAAQAFMNAASPGVIALFQPNRFYPDHASYLEALAAAMRPEYEAIVEAGYLLQLDCPDLGLGRHMMFKHKSDADYIETANLHVEALNEAVRHIPAEQMRLHVCWGNYEGPHHRDAPMEMVLPLALRAKPAMLLFESANPRHAHEWEAFQQAAIPDEKILAPGVIDSTTNFIEHPRLVAQRLCRFADIVGRERVIAATDCGFSTFAGFGSIDEDIVYAKLASLAEGAQLASETLWGRA